MNSKIDSPIKLYYHKWLKDGRKTIKIGDINLIPEYDEYSDKIYWTIENPNNNSYSSYVLKGYVDESLHDFSRLTDKTYYDLLNKKQKLETPQAIYLNPIDEKKFLEYAQKTTKFKYKELSMDIHAFDVYTTMDSDGIYFDVSVICLNPFNTIEMKKLSYNELKDLLDYYKEWDSYFDYTDYLFSDLLDYAWNEIPTLFDKTYMHTTGRIRYFTPDKKEIKLW